MKAHQLDGSDVLLRKSIYGSGIDEPICMIGVADSNAVYYYHFDGLGSVVVLSVSLSQFFASRKRTTYYSLTTIHYSQLKNLFRPGGKPGVFTYSNRPDPDYLLGIGNNKQLPPEFLRYFRSGQKLADLFLRRQT